MMKNDSSPSNLVRRCFAAYESKDKKALESLLADDFTFNSPVDDRINREKYFLRCWPNSQHCKVFHLEKIVEQGNEVFVTYECEQLDGKRFRNTEFFRTHGHQIQQVDVYFGGESDPESSEKVIRSQMKEIASLCRQKDVEGLMAHYSPEVESFDLINPLQSHGSASVKKRVEEWFSSFQGPIDYDYQDLKISASEEGAFCHALTEVRGVKTEGGKIEMCWRATVCWRKREDQWKITHIHSSVPFDMETGKASLQLKPSP